jgi:hypothetical protein
LIIRLEKGLSVNDRIFYLMKRKVLMAQPGFFDLDNRYELISRPGDPMEVMDQSILRKSLDL